MAGNHRLSCCAPGLSQKCSRALSGLFLGCSWLLLPAAACSWSPLLSSWLSCCSPGRSCYSFALLQGAIFVIKSFIRFEGVLSLGGTSKQHFWGQGIKMLQNRSTKPSELPTNHDPSKSPQAWSLQLASLGASPVIKKPFI